MSKNICVLLKDLKYKISNVSGLEELKKLESDIEKIIKQIHSNEEDSNSYLTEKLKKAEVPLKSVAVERYSPPDLSQNYIKISEEYIVSDIYSSDRVNNSLSDKLNRFAASLGGNFPSPELCYDLKKKYGYYEGEGADYINNSIYSKIVRRGQELGADLALFCSGYGDHKFKIKMVDGYAKGNFKGIVKVRFFKKKS